MSGDTAAFLAGCAVTGVAALFLARSDLAVGQRSPQIVPPVTTGIPSPVVQSPSALADPNQGWQFQTELKQQQNLSDDLSDQLKRQQSQTEDLKSQLDKQQGQTDDLKNKLEEQQRHTEQLIAQLQEQQRIIDKIGSSPVQPLRPSSRDEEPAMTVQTVVLATGAVLLVVVVGGVVVVVGVVSVLLLSRRRQTRTVHVVHPAPTPYAFPEQQQLLPARRSRQPKPMDVDYYTD